MTNKNISLTVAKTHWYDMFNSLIKPGEIPDIKTLSYLASGLPKAQIKFKTRVTDGLWHPIPNKYEEPNQECLIIIVPRKSNIDDLPLFHLIRFLYGMRAIYVGSTLCGNLTETVDWNDTKITYTFTIDYIHYRS